MGRPCLGTGAPDDAEMARRCQAVAAVAIPWIVDTLDAHGCSSPGVARDALDLLLEVSWCWQAEDEGEDEGALTRLLNPVARMLDAHTRDAGVVEAGLALLAGLARAGWDTTSQVRGCCPQRQCVVLVWSCSVCAVCCVCCVLCVACVCACVRACVCVFSLLGSQSISFFTGAQGIPKCKIGVGRGKRGRVYVCLGWLCVYYVLAVE